MKYECCSCKSIFPAEAAVDGFREGYRVGFLCPHCGANLVEGVREVRQGRSFFVAVNFYVALGAFAIMLGALSDRLAFGYVLAFIATCVFAYVYGYKKYPSEYGVIGTALGPGVTNRGAGV